MQLLQARFFKSVFQSLTKLKPDLDLYYVSSFRLLFPVLAIFVRNGKIDNLARYHRVRLANWDSNRIALTLFHRLSPSLWLSQQSFSVCLVINVTGISSHTQLVTSHKLSWLHPKLVKI